MARQARRIETVVLAAPQPWTRVDLDLYSIEVDGVVCGFVEVVGHVFVALAGGRYDRAVEVRQTLTFEDAVAALHAPRVGGAAA